MKKFEQIDIEEAKKMMAENDFLIVDIRDPEAYKETHIKDAVSLSDDNVDHFLKSADKKRPLLCYCYHGISSQQAAQFFAHAGFEKVYSLIGGFEQWRQSAPIVSD